MSSNQSKNKFYTVFNQKNTIIEENKEVLSKIRFIQNILFVKDKYEFKDIYSKIDFSKTAVLYQENQKDFVNYNDQCVPSKEDIEIIKDEDNNIEFISNNNCSSLIFISNSFYPGWQVLVDNQPLKVYQTNHLFQSVFVPAGKHQVNLIYIPTNFKVSIYLLISSSIILLAIIIYDFKKR
ncbi:hypothetical protein SDC9_128524 [bioreactor metagenome]|uniref:YfhO family protein n=1 Tax=bioreactor metagenome TaxID=1076179 RepID=A0A645CX35_9ZZZZ